MPPVYQSPSVDASSWKKSTDVWQARTCQAAGVRFGQSILSFRFETHRLDRLTIICAVDEGSRIRGVDEGSCGIWKTCAHAFALLL